MKCLLVAGARPNFMKIAPIYRESGKYDTIECKIVHTGQHYDYEMSQAFFDDLEIPEPHFFLNSGSGSHSIQTANIMTAFENVCLNEPPDMVVVVGDVNSTLACSIVAKKLLIKVAHVEAGLRSLDLTMPEEINRIVTDSIVDYFFVTEKNGVKNLLKEGKPKKNIHFVGNVMIDNLLYQKNKLKTHDVESFPSFKYKQNYQNYAFLTLHRPSNVDHKESFQNISRALNVISQDLPIIFPVHPRTTKMIEQLNIQLDKNIILLPPLSFKESLFLWMDASLVMTDSGGLQEETTALGIPCFTIRNNTERPVTITKGSNTLVGTSYDNILSAFDSFKKGQTKKGTIPKYWDGKASERILKILDNSIK